MTKSKWLKKIKMKNFKMPKMKINSNLIVKTQMKLKMINRSPTRKDLKEEDESEDEDEYEEDESELDWEGAE